jgi:RNA polymerase sigma factor (sigma-70 family)
LKHINSIDQALQLHWLAFTKGDQQAFTAIYHTCFKDLLRYGMHFHPDKSLIKECIQDLFVKIWNNHHNLPKVEQVYHYLLKSLRNTILTKISSYTRHSLYVLDDERYNFEISYPQEHQLIVHEEQLESYRQFRLAMDKLTSRQREIIYLRYIKGLDYEEVATIMDITVKAAYKLVARSLDALKQNLQQNPSSWPQLFIVFSFLSLYN